MDLNGPSYIKAAPKQQNQPSLNTAQNDSSEEFSHYNSHSESSNAIDAGRMSSSQQRKSSSQARVAANRRNAKRSTGPRTPGGKKSVSRNALKHGLLAREVVINGGDGEESQEEFDALIARLQNHYLPCGAMEEMLVERIATCWWRLARVHRAETGEIRRELDSAYCNSHVSALNKASVELSMVRSLNLEVRNQTSVPLFDPKSSMQERLEMLAKSQSELKKDLAGVTFLLSVLMQVKRDLTELGHLSDPVKELFIETFGFCDSRLIFVCNEFTAEENNAEDGKLPNSDGEDALKNAAISLINNEIERLELFRQYAPVRARYERAADVQIRSLPSADKADRLLRYETHLERQLYRAMDQLERCQRRRTGDAVLPPVNVNFRRQ